MFIVAQHEIMDPAQFWEVVRAQLARLPPGLKLRQVYPDAQGCKAVCLWEADALEAVTQFVDGVTQAFSQNLYYAVEPRYAIGLPDSGTEGLQL